MDQPAARIKVDRAWLGAPDSALLGNPTVWLFVVAAATLGRLSAFTLTVTLPLFRAVHYEHHSHTNEADRDPDFGVSRRPRALVALSCLGMLVEYRVHFYRRKLWRTKRDLTETLLMEAFLVAVFVGSLVTGTFPLLATLWFGPALIAILFLALTFDSLPHYPYDSRERFLDTRIYPGPVLNAVLLGQNYHLIHHLWTTIPWYRYQRVFREIRPELEARGSRIGWAVEPLEVRRGGRNLLRS